MSPNLKLYASPPVLIETLMKYISLEINVVNNVQIKCFQISGRYLTGVK